MYLIRHFEETVERLFEENHIWGTTHLYIGQEAIAVGVCEALKQGDLITSTHRGHGHAIAKGVSSKALLAELMGRETGCCRGRGGTQHLADFKIGFLGTNGITGGGIPIATGAALGLKLQRKENVVVCFFGDGAVNQGVFHESLNMAGLWKLPVVYVCENNFYAMSLPIKKAIPVSDIYLRAKSYGIEGIKIDGNNILEVFYNTKKAVERARAGGGATLIEAITYRWRGHSRSDQRVYRTSAEEKNWEARCSIFMFTRYLYQNKLITPEKEKKIKESVEKEIIEAIDFSLSSPFPSVDTLKEGLFS